MARRRAGGDSPGVGAATRANMCSHLREATILHADLDAFYASVEQRDDPRLRGRPVIVGAGVVLAASYEAKAHGVLTAMGGRQARRLCPDAIVVPATLLRLLGGQQGGLRVFEDTTPLVEGLSIDEAFLDVRGLRRLSGTPVEIAARLRRRVPGGGRAADHGGRRPHQVPRQGGERRRQAGRVARGAARRRARVSASAAGRAPVGRRRRDGGQAARSRHHDRGGGRARRGERARQHAGARGRPPAARARAQPRPATRRASGRRRGSIGSQRALGRRSRAAGGDRRRSLVALVDRVTRRMRAAGRVGRTVVLRLRFDDFSRATRSHTPALGDGPDPRRSSRRPEGSWRPRCRLIESRGNTLVGVAVANLEDAASSSSACRSTARAAARSTQRSTRCGTGSARAR